MDQFTHHTITSSASKIIHYITGGPSDGPLIIFIHGWPGLAETWTPQLLKFASLGFFVAAADTEGYGKSSSSRDFKDYACERLVQDQLTLLKDLNRKEAIWVAHDWGSGILWTLVQHFPEVCIGVANLCVPYRVLELGVEEALGLVNRDIYPEDEYPYGQWDYMIFYEQDPDKVTAQFDQNVSRTLKLLYTPGDRAGLGKPSRTSNVIKNQGWFGGEAAIKANAIPDIPLERTVLTPTLYDSLVESASKHGFFGASAYYRNHAANRAYNLKVEDPTLNMPVLFVHAKYDHTCETLLSKMADPMRKLCTDLTEETVDAGHWANLEKADEVNDALKAWIKEKLPSQWPKI